MKEIFEKFLHVFKNKFGIYGESWRNFFYFFSIFFNLCPIVKQFFLRSREDERALRERERSDRTLKARECVRTNFYMEFIYNREGNFSNFFYFFKYFSDIFLNFFWNFLQIFSDIFSDIFLIFFWNFSGIFLNFLKFFECLEIWRLFPSSSLFQFHISFFKFIFLCWN